MAYQNHITIQLITEAVDCGTIEYGTSDKAVIVNYRVIGATTMHHYKGNILWWVDQIENH